RPAPRRPPAPPLIDQLTQSPRPRVVAAAWLHRDGDRVLGVRSHRSPQWFLPGGVPETGESLSVATAREVGEEIGVTVDPESLREVLRLREYAARRPAVEVELIGHVEEIDRAPLDPAALTLAAGEIDDAAWLSPADGE